MGSAGTGLVAMCEKNFDHSTLLDVIQSTAVTSEMIFLVLLGAEFFNAFIALTKLPPQARHFDMRGGFSVVTPKRHSTGQSGDTR